MKILCMHLKIFLCLTAAAILLGIGAALIFIPGVVLIVLRWLVAGLCILAGAWLLASLVLYAIDARQRRKKNDSCAV